MAYTAVMSDASLPSARNLRSRYRDAEGDTARLHLLSTACLTLADQGASPDALAAILTQALRFLAVEEGALLFYEGGVLGVHAAQGPVAPVGVRLAAVGALASAMRPPMQPVVRQDVDSSLRLGREPRVGLEVLVPLRFGSRVGGVLALLSPRSLRLPTTEDLRTLQALAGLLGVAQASQAKSTPRTLGKDSVASLTPRERQVFALLPRGLTNPEMAEQLGIATGTVKLHVARILHKLGVTDRTQAAVRAADWGYGI